VGVCVFFIRCRCGFSQMACVHLLCLGAGCHVFRCWVLADGLCALIMPWCGLSCFSLLGSHRWLVCTYAVVRVVLFFIVGFCVFFMWNSFWLWSCLLVFSFSALFVVVGFFLVVFFLCSCCGWSCIGECSVVGGDCVNVVLLFSKTPISW
jgi:hypothetical protein